MRYRRYPGFQLNPILVLIIVNVLLFIVTLFVPALIFVLGLQPAGLLLRPWTILTNLFIHGGFWHIFANMFTLYFFGNYLYRLIGKSRFLMLYFGGGILGNIFHVVLTLLGEILSVSFLGSPFIPVVGASGAIFALGGTLTVMRPKLKVFIIPIPVPLPLWVAIVGGFIILSFLPNVAWQAHLGGLVLGLIAGYFFRRRELRYYFFRS